MKSMISWALFGVLSYVWYWCAYLWPYLQGQNWAAVWVLLTIVVIIIHRRNGVAAVGASVIESVIDRVKTIVGSLIGLIVANVVAVTINSLVVGAFTVNGYVQGAVVVVGSAILTSAWLGALDDATQ